MSLKDKYSFDELKDLDQREISAKLAANEFSVPAEDQEKFKEFAEAAPGSEARTKILNDLTKPDGEEPGTTDVTPEETASQTLETPEKTDTPIPAQGGGDTPDGAGEETQPVDGTELLNKLYAVEQERDSHRKANSRIGNQLKEKENEIADLQKRLSELEKASKPPVEDLKIPIVPNPKDYDEGLLDERYSDDLARYNQELTEYSKKAGDTPPKWARDILETVSDVRKKADEAYNFATTQTQQSVESQIDKGWDQMWEKTQEIQKKLGLDTGKLEPKTLNHYVLRAANTPGPDGSTPYSPEEQANAKAYLSQVDKSHMDNFNKLSSVVSTYFRFDDEVPQKVYDLPDETVLPGIVQKLGLNVNVVVPADNVDPVVALSNKQQTDSLSETATLSNDLGNPQDTVQTDLSFNDKAEKFNTMSETYRMNARRCEADPEFMAEFTALKKEMFDHVNQ